MEPEVVVLSRETRIDDYKNFFFKDKAGNEHKIGAKRTNFDELCNLIVVNPDKAVKLTYDEYKGRSYIVGVAIVADELPEPTAVKTSAAHTPQQYAPQEIGMWFNNLCAGIRDGSIERDFPKSHVYIKQQVYKMMSERTSIKFKKEEEV